MEGRAREAPADSAAPGAIRTYVIIFFVALLLGLAGGVALGVFAYPYPFLADIVATEKVDKPAPGQPERKVLARGTFVHANPADPIHYGKGRVTVYEGLLHLVPDFEVMPLGEILDPVIDRLATSAHRSVTQDVPADLPPIRIDAALLDRVVSNLLENAVKYSGDGAPIVVSARRDGDSMVAVTVEDGGPGVPTDQLGAIFDRFSQVEPSSSAGGSVGSSARRRWTSWLTGVRNVAPCSPVSTDSRPKSSKKRTHSATSVTP